MVQITFLFVSKQELSFDAIAINIDAGYLAAIKSLVKVPLF